MACEIKDTSDIPLCSGSLEVLEVNTKIMDQYINSAEFFVTDRLGVPRKTWAGIEKEAQDHIEGFENLINDKIIGQGGIQVLNEWIRLNNAPPSSEFLMDNLGFVTVEMFGAIGDGISDDTFAFIQAINSGSVINLNSDSTYLISSISGTFPRVFINGNGSKIISESKNVISFNDNFKYSTQVVSGGSVGSLYWELSDTSMAKVGDIVVFKSSESWYFDPRPETTDARVSLTATISSISGNRISVSHAPAFPFNIPNNTVEASIYTPSSVIIKDLNIKAINNDQLIGIKISCSNEPTLLNVTIDGFKSEGVTFDRCVNALCSGGKRININRNGDSYACKTLGSTGTIFENIVFENCYLGVDISGWDIISNQSWIRDCTFIGGGMYTDGSYAGFSPNGSVASYQKGCGAHGASSGLLMTNNKFINMHAPIVSFGEGIIAFGNSFIGKSVNACVRIDHGRNAVISSNNAMSSNFGYPDRLIDIMENFDNNYFNRVIVTNNSGSFKYSLVRTYLQESFVKIFGNAIDRYTNDGNTYTLELRSGRTGNLGVNSIIEDTSLSERKVGYQVISNNISRGGINRFITSDFCDSSVTITGTSSGIDATINYSKVSYKNDHVEIEGSFSITASSFNTIQYIDISLPSGSEGRSYTNYDMLSPIFLCGGNLSTDPPGRLSFIVTTNSLNLQTSNIPFYFKYKAN